MTIEDELSRLFQAERAVQPPPSALGAGWSRLALDMAARAPALPVAAGPLKMALSIVPKWIVGGFALGLLGAGGAVLVAPSASHSSTPHASVATAAARPHSSIARARAEASGAGAREPAPVGAPLAVENARPASANSRGGAPGAPPDSTFDAELGLITLAKAELDRGNPSGARAALARHAELFPTGAFATERDALTMIAQCQVGPQNPDRGRQFAALHPGSPLVQRVDRACAARAPNAEFPKLLNGDAPPGEPMAEPRGGTRQ